MKWVSITPAVVKPQMTKLQNSAWKTGLVHSSRAEAPSVSVRAG